LRRRGPHLLADVIGMLDDNIAAALSAGASFVARLAVQR
jgi:hypothetical protein